MAWRRTTGVMAWRRTTGRMTWHRTTGLNMTWRHTSGLMTWRHTTGLMTWRRTTGPKVWRCTTVLLMLCTVATGYESESHAEMSGLLHVPPIRPVLLCPALVPPLTQGQQSLAVVVCPALVPPLTQGQQSGAAAVCPALVRPLTQGQQSRAAAVCPALVPPLTQGQQSRAAALVVPGAEVYVGGHHLEAVLPGRVHLAEVVRLGVSPAVAVQLSDRCAVRRLELSLCAPVGDAQPDAPAARQAGHAQVLGQRARRGQRRVELGAALLGRRVVARTQLQGVAAAGARRELLRTLSQAPRPRDRLRRRRGYRSLSEHIRSEGLGRVQVTL